MELKLSTEDRELLARVLDQTIRDMRPEVRRTSNPAYHDALKAEEARLKALLEQLQAAA